MVSIKPKSKVWWISRFYNTFPCIPFNPISNSYDFWRNHLSFVVIWCERIISWLTYLCLLPFMQNRPLTRNLQPTMTWALAFSCCEVLFIFYVCLFSFCLQDSRLGPAPQCSFVIFTTCILSTSRVFL